MVVCKFFEQGNCKFGQSCRFEHPTGGNRTQPGNRFAAAFGSGSSGGAFGSASNSNSNTAQPAYNMSKETVERELTSELPQWILSAYAPARDTPEQLFGGPMREQSFEEMRLRHMMAEASGNPQAALNDAQQLYQQAQQQIQTVLGNVDGAVQFIRDAENKHPNRIDICKQNSQNSTGAFAKDANSTQTSSAFGQQQANPFGSNQASSSNPFSANTQSSSAFGAPNPSTTGAFGQVSSSGTGAFGQAGQTSGSSAFGQASGGTTSAFGQPSAMGQKSSPFGAPSFGKPAAPASAFGQPAASAPFGSAAASNPQSGSAFGKPGFGQPAFGQSGFNAAAKSASPFGGGQPSQAAATTSAFGKPSALGQTNSAFGQPAFGQASKPTGPSAFGQPSALGQSSNPFGQATAANTNSPFGSAAGAGSSTASPFGQAASNTDANKQNPFGAPTQAANPSPFGQAAQPAQPAQPASSNPFGQPAQPQSASANNPFGSKPDAQPNGFNNAGSAPNNPFGQPANNASPFGQQPQQAQAQAQAPGAFGSGGGAPNPFGGNAPAAAHGAAAGNASPYPPGSTRQHPDINSYASKTMNGQLTQFKGKPVTYKDGVPGIRAFNGSWARIWFPNGPPGYYKDTEVPAEEYDEKSKAQWASFAQSGTFAGGMMPDLPPMREICTWDF